MAKSRAESSADHGGIKRRPSRRDSAFVRGSSAVVRGSTLLPTSDGRSAWARIARDTFSALVSHCGGGDMISETQRISARRVSFLEAELVLLEDKFAAARDAGGEPSVTDIDLYNRMAGSQRRLAEPLGWERIAKDLTPTLQQYFAAKREAEGSSS